MPALEARLVGGESWTLAQERPAKLALLAFYRGVFCPVCRTWLADFERLLPEFDKRGVSVIALSCDEADSAAKSKDEWGLRHLRVGYNLGVDAARAAGLYISAGRGVNPATGQKEPRLFTEPGVLAVTPAGTLYAAWLQSVPYARPHLAEIVTAVDNFVAHGLPAPRGSS